MAKRFIKACLEPKSFLKIENAYHNDFRQIGGSAYESAISDFLAKFIHG